LPVDLWVDYIQVVSDDFAALKVKDLHCSFAGCSPSRVLCVLIHVVQAQFELAKDAMATWVEAGGAQGSPAAAAAAAAAAQDAPPEPAAAEQPAAAPAAAALAGGAPVSHGDALTSLHDLPHNIRHMILECFADSDPGPLSAAVPIMRQAWGDRAVANWEALCSACSVQDPRMFDLMAAESPEPEAAPGSPGGLLQLDKALLELGESAQRASSVPSASMQMDSMGFVTACLGPVSIHQVGTASLLHLMLR
jgi:pyruvate/2-oxoglutarate dehydrogenase complex dihydrolipoamide acyltransferase (E2) component